MATIRTLGPGTFDAAVGRAPTETRKIAAAVRALIGEVMPGVIEVAWEQQGNVGYGVGPKKGSEQFCYIMPFAAHVNLGFFYGADLDDPAGLLEGTGKGLRHVKIRSVEDVKKPALRKLVAQASKHLPKLKK